MTRFRFELPMFKVRNHLSFVLLAAVLGCAAPQPPPEIWSVAACMQNALVRSGSATDVQIENLEGYPVVVFNYLGASGGTSRGTLEMGVELDDRGTIQSRYLFLNSLESREDWDRIGMLVEGACNASQVLVLDPHPVS